MGTNPMSINNESDLLQKGNGLFVCSVYSGPDCHALTKRETKYNPNMCAINVRQKCLSKQSKLFFDKKGI